MKFFLVLLLPLLVISKPLISPYPVDITFGKESKKIQPCGLVFRLFDPSLKELALPSYMSDIINFNFKSHFQIRNCVNDISFLFISRGSPTIPNIINIVLQNKDLIMSDKTDESYKLTIPIEGSN